MIAIAVTGGAATGKSTFCTRFREEFGGHTVEILSSDRIVADLLEQKEVRSLIRELPGGRNAFRGGQLDKSLLRKLVFANSDFREKLERLLHPQVLEQLETSRVRLNRARALLLIEVPLLYEVDFPVPRDMDLVVGAATATQLRRLKQERGLPAELADQILDAQKPMEEKIARSDLVVWNDGSLELFESQIRHLAGRCQTYIS